MFTKELSAANMVTIWEDGDRLRTALQVLVFVLEMS